MPDYAAAVAAIKTRAASNWTTTPLGFLNEADPAKEDSQGEPTPWVLCEIVSSGSTVVGTGTPGNQTIVYDGLIKFYVFIPAGTAGTGIGFTHAVALGDLFKNKLFYNDTPGFYVRTGFPYVEDGDAGSEDGNWFGVTATIPFEYWHRG